MLSLQEWRSGFAASETIQRVRPEGTAAPLLNPHRGTTTFQRFEGDELQADHSWHDESGPTSFSPPQKQTHICYPATTVSYCRWPWSVLEPSPGEYRFDFIRGALDAAKLRRQTLQIRFEPYVLDDIPKWLVASGMKLQPSAKPPGPEIDSNDPLYLKHWTTFVRAIGKAFDGYPNLDHVDIAYAGRYGEMGGNATIESTRTLVDAYVEAFPNTHLLSMIGTLGCAYAASLPGKNIGWRGDGFLDVKYRAPGVVPDGLVWHHMYDEYPRHLIEQNLRDVWQHAPVSLEPYHTVWHLLKAEGFSRDIAWQLEQCLKYHPSTFMAKSVEIPEQWMDTYRKFDQKLGYRFFIHQMMLPRAVARGETLTATLTIDNQGVAPIYKGYRFALRFCQERQSCVVPFNADIRRWLPDFSHEKEVLQVPATLASGPARVECAIVDAQNTPRVKLAHKDIESDGWHPLTWVNVS